MMSTILLTHPPSFGTLATAILSSSNGAHWNLSRPWNIWCTRFFQVALQHAEFSALRLHFCMCM